MIEDNADLLASVLSNENDIRNVSKTQDRQGIKKKVFRTLSVKFKLKC